MKFKTVRYTSFVNPVYIFYGI